MKKLVALMLVCLLAFAAVACGEETTENSQATSSNAEDTSVTDESSVDEETETEVSAEASAEASTEASTEVSTEASSEASTEASTEASSEDSVESSEAGDDPVDEVNFVTQFISWKKHYCDKAEIYEVVNTDPTSLKLSKVNSSEVKAGDIAVFTSDYGGNIGSDTQNYKDFAVIVFEYDHEVFSYVKKSFAKVGKADSKTKIPEDGYVVAIHKDYADKIDAIEALSDTTPFFPHGFIASDILDAKIPAAKTAPTLDGKITEGEYGGNLIWDIMPDNEGISYYQFEVNDYYATAKLYATYDKDNLYVGVVVDSPRHYNVLSPENAGNMWQYECIQLQFSSIAPNDEYFFDNWDGIRNKTAAEANVTRQTGYAVNEEGQTLITVWQGKAEAGHKAVCVRDDENAKTYYEIVIPWSDLGSGDDVVDVKKGSSFGMAISINCGDDITFRNIVLRDGGGIMGCNDWTKIPTLTLG